MSVLNVWILFHGNTNIPISAILGRQPADWLSSDEGSGLVQRGRHAWSSVLDQTQASKERDTQRLRRFL